MDAAVSTLAALAIFESTIKSGVVRSVHGYKVVGRKAGVGWVRWERWVERGFFLSPGGNREVGVSTDAPQILQAEWRARPVFHQGQMVGGWRCILVFDSVSGVAPSFPPPPMLCPIWNPQLRCLPNLYNDLEKVFRFQSAENLPKLIHSNSKQQRRQSIHSSGRIPDEVEHSSNSDDTEPDEDPRSAGIDLLPPDKKHQRANKRHIASITLVEIAQCFHLPITEASKTLKIGVSMLKKKCREYGVPRWPHRKFKSLDSLIHDIESVLEDQIRDDVQEEEKHAVLIRALTQRKRMLETEKETIRQKPASYLMNETMQFRECVFKRRNRAKRESG